MSDRPLFYLVSIWIDKAVADDWQRWMHEVHIPDVIDTGCFDNTWMCREPEEDTDERLAYRMVYLATSKAAFERYEAEFAAELQADHSARYAGKFKAARALCEVVAEFGSPS